MALKLVLLLAFADPKYRLSHYSLRVNIKLGGINAAMEPNTRMRTIDIRPSASSNLVSKPLPFLTAHKP